MTSLSLSQSTKTDPLAATLQELLEKKDAIAAKINDCRLIIQKAEGLAHQWRMLQASIQNAAPRELSWEEHEAERRRVHELEQLVISAGPSSPAVATAKAELPELEAEFQNCAEKIDFAQKQLHHRKKVAALKAWYEPFLAFVSAQEQLQELDDIAKKNGWPNGNAGVYLDHGPQRDSRGRQIPFSESVTLWADILLAVNDPIYVARFPEGHPIHAKLEYLRRGGKIAGLGLIWG